MVSGFCDVKIAIPQHQGDSDVGLVQGHAALNSYALSVQLYVRGHGHIVYL